jgi:hypothetical protein
MSDEDTAWICPRCGHFIARQATSEQAPTHDCGGAGRAVEFVPYVDSAQALRIRNDIDSTSTATTTRRSTP